MTGSAFWDAGITPDQEPRRVTLIKGEWMDAARRGRVVPYKIYVPEAAQPNENFPVIIWSHGLGGSRDGAGFLSRFVAAHGYVIVHVTHPGTDTSLWEGQPGHPWEVIRRTRIPRHAVLDRYKDIPFVLRQLRAGFEVGLEPALMSMNLDALGMSGHSFGALTTQVMAGQRTQRGRRHYDLHQPDFKAGILYSPVPGRRDPQDPAFAYGGIRIPLLHMTGTDDESPLEGFGYERRLAVFDHAGAQQGQHLLILDKGDHMVFNGSRGGLADNPVRARHEEVIKILSLAWWDWHLKGDERAKAWLTGAGAAAYLGADARLLQRESPKI